MSKNKELIESVDNLKGLMSEDIYLYYSTLKDMIEDDDLAVKERIKCIKMVTDLYMKLQENVEEEETHSKPKLGLVTKIDYGKARITK